MAPLTIAARGFVPPEATPKFKPGSPQIRVLPGSKMANHREQLAYDTAVWANPDNFFKPWLALLTLGTMLAAMGAWQSVDFNPEWRALKSPDYTDDTEAVLPAAARAELRQAETAANDMFDLHRK